MKLSLLPLPLNVHEFDNVTKTFSIEEVGLFTMLIHHQWSHGYLPTRPELIARIAPIGKGQWSDLISPEGSFNRVFVEAKAVDIYDCELGDDQTVLINEWINDVRTAKLTKHLRKSAVMKRVNANRGR